MRIGVFGDVHANFAALEAVLTALEAEECDVLVCTGDVVGYGPSPAECIARLRERQVPCVLGNHDKYVTLLADPSLEKLDPAVRAAITWTQGVLSMDDLRWLAALPFRFDGDGFAVIHGCLGPHRWRYIVDGPSLAEHFAYQDVPLVFSGHSHLPILGTQAPGRPPRLGFLSQARIPAGVKAVLNPGSVGQPRDRDPRAAAAVYEADSRTVRVLRVAYDIAATQVLMRQAGLPERFVERLAEGR
ncbi:MAG: metallophosphoesterase family protein [Kiritimatiellaeota bacterium]|nr:metallophosphoesterase family protein [Kiritimatiellota bacterium]